MAMIFFFLRVRYNKEMTFMQKIRRIDYLGNVMLIASTVSVLWSLTYGGAILPWTSWRVIFPLVIGIVGLILFMALESSKYVKEPVVPVRLFGNRTSATIFAATFLNSALLYWMLFFLPIYFQSVLLASPARSGVMLLPAIVVAVPAAIVAVILLVKWGRYKPLHFFGFGVCTIGLGLITLFDENTSTAEWVIYQLIAAAGSGFVLNTLLPGCQAGLEEKDQAAATATWSFVRSFGAIWGVAIPAAIFNNRFQQLSGRITDSNVAAIFSNGNAYQHADARLLNSFTPETRAQVVSVFSESLKRVWYLSILFSGVSFLLVFIEKEINMRTELETEFGIEEKQKSKDKDIENGTVLANVAATEGHDLADAPQEKTA
jgi:hypothetical protein